MVRLLAIVLALAACAADGRSAMADSMTVDSIRVHVLDEKGNPFPQQAGVTIYRAATYVGQDRWNPGMGLRRRTEGTNRIATFSHDNAPVTLNSAVYLVEVETKIDERIYKGRGAVFAAPGEAAEANIVVVQSAEDFYHRAQVAIGNHDRAAFDAAIAEGRKWVGYRQKAFAAFEREVDRFKTRFNLPEGDGRDIDRMIHAEEAPPLDFRVNARIVLLRRYRSLLSRLAYEKLRLTFEKSGLGLSYSAEVAKAEERPAGGKDTNPAPGWEGSWFYFCPSCPDPSPRDGFFRMNRDGTITGDYFWAGTDRWKGQFFDGHLSFGGKVLQVDYRNVFGVEGRLTLTLGEDGNSFDGMYALKGPSGSPSGAVSGRRKSD